VPVLDNDPRQCRTGPCVMGSRDHGCLSRTSSSHADRPLCRASHSASTPAHCMRISCSSQCTRCSFTAMCRGAFCGGWKRP